MRGLLAVVIAATVSGLLRSVAVAPAPVLVPQPWSARFTFAADRPAEVIASIRATCDLCAWDRKEHEAVVLRLELDGRYSQHLPLVRTGRAEYRVALGPVAAGTHRLRLEQDPLLTSPGLPDGAVTVEATRFEQTQEDAPEHVALSLAPILHARPDAISRFTDVPVFMWYETEPTVRGTRYRYSVIFTNEDGGTPADRLMATWGRTTDIEYVYSVEVDWRGQILDDDYQGPDHETLPFRGKREGRHPLLWVATQNNMLLDRGETTVRYAPAPKHFPLANVSREAVMDAHPWLYDVMARELRREGKIVPDAPPKLGVIPDPRRYVYVEACGEAGVTALAFSVRAGDAWYASDRGVPEYRIVRAGCFRGAVPLPEGIELESVRALRFDAYERPHRPGAGQPTSDHPTARLTRINALFTLDAQYLPTASRLQWQGDIPLKAGQSTEFVLR